MKLHVRPGSLYRANKQPLLGLRPSLMRLDLSTFSFSPTISSTGFPLNFMTAAIPPSTLLNLIPSSFGAGKLLRQIMILLCGEVTRVFKDVAC